MAIDRAQLLADLQSIAVGERVDYLRGYYGCTHAAAIELLKREGLWKKEAQAINEQFFQDLEEFDDELPNE